MIIEEAGNQIRLKMVLSVFPLSRDAKSSTKTDFVDPALAFSMCSFAVFYRILITGCGFGFNVSSLAKSRNDRSSTMLPK